MLGSVTNPPLTHMKVPLSLPFPDRLRQSFGVASATHLLRKALREFDDFKRSGDIQRSGDHAFNLCVSIWHLHDWSFADMSPEERARASEYLCMSIRKKSDFAAAVQKSCKEVRICRVMATAGKHVVVDTFPDPTIATAFASYEHLHDDSEPLIWRWSLSCGDTHLDAEDMFNTALEFWRKLFEHLGWLESRFISADPE